MQPNYSTYTSPLCQRQFEQSLPARSLTHPRTLPETKPDSVTMRTLQPPLSWQLYMHLSSGGSEDASEVNTDSVLNSLPEAILLFLMHRS